MLSSQYLLTHQPHLTHTPHSSTTFSTRHEGLMMASVACKIIACSARSLPTPWNVESVQTHIVSVGMSNLSKLTWSVGRTLQLLDFPGQVDAISAPAISDSPPKRLDQATNLTSQRSSLSSTILTYSIPCLSPSTFSYGTDPPSSVA